MKKGGYTNIPTKNTIGNNCPLIRMKAKTILAVIFVWIIGFSFGYFISIPNHITIDLNANDFVKISENMDNLSLRCPDVICRCEYQPYYYPMPFWYLNNTFYYNFSGNYTKFNVSDYYEKMDTK